MQAVSRWNTLAPVPLNRIHLLRLLNTATYTQRWARNASSIPSRSPNSPQNPRDDGDDLLTDVTVEPFKKSPQGNHRGAGSNAFIRNDFVNALLDEEVIIPESLADTLQAHRIANRKATNIRRVNRAPSPNGSNPFTKPAHYGYKSLEIDRGDAFSTRSERTEYEGRVRPLGMQWEIIGEVSRYLRLPWMEALDRDGPSTQFANERLAAEMLSADFMFTPSAEETASCTHAREQLEGWVKSRWPTAQLDTIGSRASGLATPLSDVDLNLTMTHVDPGHRAEMSTHTKDLAELYAMLKKEKGANKYISLSYFLSRARVPIIVGTHPGTGLEMQIQAADTAYGSLETVKGLLAEHSNLGPLFKIIKHMLKLRGLTSGPGGITSYPLLNMIAIILKLNPLEGTPKHLAVNLIKFLDFWSDIDFYNTGITHIPSTYVDNTSKPLQEYFADKQTTFDTIDAIVRDPVGARPALFKAKQNLSEIHEGTDNFMMVFHDPANPHNDLGRSATAIKHFQATLIDIRRRLKDDMAGWDRMLRATGQVSQPGPSLLRSFLEADYTLYNLERKRVTSRTID